MKSGSPSYAINGRDMVRGKNNNGQPPKPKEKDGKEEKPFVDRQMQKALDYLKGL